MKHAHRDPPLSPATKAYLAAFTRELTSSGDEYVAAKAQRHVCFADLMDETQMRPSGRQHFKRTVAG